MMSKRTLQLIVQILKRNLLLHKITKRCYKRDCTNLNQNICQQLDSFIFCSRFYTVGKLWLVLLGNYTYYNTIRHEHIRYQSIHCSKCGKFIGEIDYDAVVILPKCGKCADPIPEGDDKMAYLKSRYSNQR